MSQSRFARTRLTAPEYAALRAHADEKGMTVSEYLRELIVSKREALDVGAALARIEAGIVAHLVAGDDPHEALLVEVLLLVRELVAARNGQLLGQVSQKVRSLYPHRRAVV